MIVVYSLFLVHWCRKISVRNTINKRANTCKFILWNTINGTSNTPEGCKFSYPPRGETVQPYALCYQRRWTLSQICALYLWHIPLRISWSLLLHIISSTKCGLSYSLSNNHLQKIPVAPCPHLEKFVLDIWIVARRLLLIICKFYPLGYQAIQFDVDMLPNLFKDLNGLFLLLLLLHTTTVCLVVLEFGIQNTFWSQQ